MLGAGAFRAYHWPCWLNSRGAGEKTGLEESPDTAGRGGRETDPGKPAGKGHRNTPPKGRSHVHRSRQGGKGAVRAPRRRGDTPARQTPPGARPSRDDDAARRVPGRPHRWMAVRDRIRLTDQLREGPRRLPGPFLSRLACHGTIVVWTASASSVSGISRGIRPFSAQPRSPGSPPQELYGQVFTTAAGIKVGSLSFGAALAGPVVTGLGSGGAVLMAAGLQFAAAAAGLTLMRLPIRARAVA